MDLSKLQNLSTEDKLRWLRCTAGLQQLGEWLSKGISQRQIATMIGIDSKTLYRWRKYPEIADAIAPYTPVKSPVKVEPVNLSREAAYRIVCAFEDHKTYLKGAIYGEYSTPQELWNCGFLQEYFDTFGVSACEYQEQYFADITSKGVYIMNNYTRVLYCEVSAKDKIIPLAPKNA